MFQLQWWWPSSSAGLPSTPSASVMSTSSTPRSTGPSMSISSTSLVSSTTSVPPSTPSSTMSWVSNTGQNSTKLIKLILSAWTVTSKTPRQIDDLYCFSWDIPSYCPSYRISIMWLPSRNVNRCFLQTGCRRRVLQTVLWLTYSPE